MDAGRSPGNGHGRDAPSPRPATASQVKASRAIAARRKIDLVGLAICAQQGTVAPPARKADNRPCFPRYLGERRKAGEGTRTLDIQLGKLALYQLSYARIAGSLADFFAVCLWRAFGPPERTTAARPRYYVCRDFCHGFEAGELARY